MKDSPNINSRPPIVTLMGHVDHGKTTLLDSIRKTNVVSREHGGITQHIGAYQISYQNKLITFVDTPGHAAFEKMRSRGAEVADIVILVVAATEGAKPQTVEAIKHIHKANKPIIVAFTKIDLPNINLEKIKKELQSHEVTVEDFGGDVPMVEVSAPKSQGINDLLEMVNLVWQLSPEPSLPNDPLEAVVVESFMDKRRGSVISVIVKKGTLRVGQKIEVDGEAITVRALISDQGKSLKEAEPSKPVEILGFKKLLEVGSVVHQFITTKTQVAKKSLDFADIVAKSLGVRDRFKIILKADVSGSLEAITSNLPANVYVVASSVGEISPKDITSAKTAQAPILAFNIKIPTSVKNQAEREGVVIKNYTVIYELLSDVQSVLESFEQAKIEVKFTGKAKIIASFTIEGKKIAGAVVTTGKIKTGDQIILTSGEQKKDAKIISLKKFKKDTSEVSSGQECGILLSPNLDFKAGDIIESLG